MSNELLPLPEAPDGDLRITTFMGAGMYVEYESTHADVVLTVPEDDSVRTYELRMGADLARDMALGMLEAAEKALACEALMLVRRNLRDIERWKKSGSVALTNDHIVHCMKDVPDTDETRFPKAYCVDCHNPDCVRSLVQIGRG